MNALVLICPCRPSKNSVSTMSDSKSSMNRSILALTVMPNSFALVAFALSTRKKIVLPVGLSALIESVAVLAVAEESWVIA